MLPSTLVLSPLREDNPCPLCRPLVWLLSQGFGKPRQAVLSPLPSHLLGWWARVEMLTAESKTIHNTTCQCQPALHAPAEDLPPVHSAGTGLGFGAQCACSKALHREGARPLFSAHRPCPGGIVPTFPPSAGFFQSIPEGRILTIALKQSDERSGV